MMEATKEKLPDVVLPKCEQRKILKGQKALITGGSSGIGQGVAFGMARAGADVAINYLSSDKEARLMIEEIEKEELGVNAICVKADVSSEKDVLDMYEKMFDSFGTIDILVSNAGMQSDAPLHEMTLEKWNKVLQVNLTGQFLCIREAVKEYRRRGVKEDVSCAAGKIICMSSVHQQIPWAGHVNYAASKGGIMMMMKSIAQEVAGYRIRVNSICPGAIRTDINKPAWDTPEAYQDLMKLVPYNRIGEVDDIARCAVWLASDEADYVTGASFFVDGGMTLYPGFATGG